MPWCESCASYRAPSALSPEGECRTCSSLIEADTEIPGRNVTTADLRAIAGEEAPGPVPWHFKLMVVMLVAYLGWRVVQIFV